MPTIACFKRNSDFEHRSSVSLVTVVSMGSKKQSGDSFDAFISLLNKRPNITKLTIVVSGGLHRHYIRLKKEHTEDIVIQLSKNMDSDWINAHQTVLSRLNCSYNILTWDELLKINEGFQYFFLQVKNAYDREDKYFRYKVNQHSGEYYAKKLYQQIQEKMQTKKKCKI
jgi:hypothetical protein